MLPWPAPCLKAEVCNILTHYLPSEEVKAINIHFGRWDRKRCEPFKGLAQSDYMVKYYLLLLLPPLKKVFQMPSRNWGARSLLRKKCSKSLPWKKCFKSILWKNCSRILLQKSVPEAYMISFYYFLLWKTNDTVPLTKKMFQLPPWNWGARSLLWKKVFQQPPLKIFFQKPPCYHYYRGDKEECEHWA